jgi:ElaB/YqjD/DUF883 family membrane-anchored ribosome-binding protein
MAESLEQGIKDGWRLASGAVTESFESAATKAVAMRHAVADTLDDATGAMVGALDVSAHARRHPWVVCGAAMLLGIVVGVLVTRLRR